MCVRAHGESVKKSNQIFFSALISWSVSFRVDIQPSGVCNLIPLKGGLSVIRIFACNFWQFWKWFAGFQKKKLKKTQKICSLNKFFTYFSLAFLSWVDCLRRISVAASEEREMIPIPICFISWRVFERSAEDNCRVSICFYNHYLPFHEK